MTILRHIADVPLYAAIGVGPLVAGRTVVDGFIGAHGAPWLTRSSLTIEWLVFSVLGYFFTRTLVGLALDYETFWRLPGRCERVCRAAGGGDSPRAAARARGKVGG